jgi:argininosuccinate synthase
MEKIVLAYSGGLTTSVAIPWLADRYRAEVVTLTIDIGQGKELDDVRERALAIGAARAHVVDAREEFARDFILPALQAGALYDGRSPLATALSRPLIVKHLVNIAHIEGATAVAHGCAGKINDNDQVRIEVLARGLDPDIRILAPAREWNLGSGGVEGYARARGIPVSIASEGPYSTDTNLWGYSIAGGIVEDPQQDPPEEIYRLTKSPAEAPDTPAIVDIEFAQGVPTKINGVGMSLVELIQSLETIAGVHGVGRIDMVENYLAGAKSREVYEAPSAVVLHTAHRELQTVVTPRDLERLTSDLSVRYADLVYNGQWFTPTREAIDAFMASVQRLVSGSIRLKFFKGECRVIGRQPVSGDRGSRRARS